MKRSLYCDIYLKHGSFGSRAKLLLTATFLIGLMSACTQAPDPASLKNAAIYYQSQSKIKNSFHPTQPVSVDSWLLKFQNPLNQLPSLSVDTTEFTPVNVSTVALGAKYYSTNIIPNMVVACDGNIYLVNGENYLLSVDPTSGKVISKTYIKSLENDLPIGLAAEGDFIYITTAYGNVIALFNTGVEIWKTSLLYPLQTAPIVKANCIYVTANNTVYCLNASNGEIKWSFKGVRDGVSYKVATTVTLYHNLVIAGLTNGAVVVLHKENGQLLYQYKSPSYLIPGSVVTQSITAPPLAVSEHALLVSSANNMTLSLDPVDNKQIWQAVNTSYINLPIISGKTAFVLDKNLALTSLNLTDGSAYWSTNLPSQNLTSMQWFGPIMLNNKLVVWNAKGFIYIISPESGDISNYYHLPLAFLDKLSGSFAVFKQKLLILGFKNLYILN